ncbi:basic proline-rich protein-like [Physeter macrocephalus]|uniref:Basic proline-rich protein-like n=1 Tax=Physeter macrocephalus TaxID=9755 RepID=A0A9W2X2R7_PHYMC|nr:basic proline-rich protein-like [Physeter catodon]
MIPSKTALTSDIHCKFGVSQATYTSDQLAANSGVPMTHSGCGCRGDFLCRPPPPPPPARPLPARTHGRRVARSGGRASERGPRPGRGARRPRGPAQAARPRPPGTCGRRRTPAGPALPRAKRHRWHPAPPTSGRAVHRGRPRGRPAALGARDGPARPALSPALVGGSASSSPHPRKPTPTSAFELRSAPFSWPSATSATQTAADPPECPERPPGGLAPPRLFLDGGSSGRCWLNALAFTFQPLLTTPPLVQRLREEQEMLYQHSWLPGISV